jgi:DMSO/TMAO reductase YedYZ molybdopterin-dependent catalytic subunit
MVLDTEASPESADARRVVRMWGWGALSGVLAAGAALAVGELAAGIVGGSSPVVSVGELVIEHAPSWLKDFAIETFGEDDKPALILGTAGTLVLVSLVLGALSARRLWVGLTGTAALGVVGAYAALTRPAASLADIWPSVAAGVVAALVLVVLLRPGALARVARRAGRVVGVAPAAASSPASAAPPSSAAPPPSPSGAPSSAAPPSSVREASPAVMRPTRAPAPPGFDRRRFLVSALAVGGGAIVAGGAGRALQGRFSVSADRAAIALPPPARPAAALPAGSDLAVGGITPFVTPNGDFYRVDTALTVPQVDPSSWELTIGGMVDDPITLTFQDLLDRELVERDITLVCVSNEVGGPYAGTARWLGVPMAALLEEAGVQAGADQVVSRSVDGWTAGTPTELLLDGRDALLAIGMNGEPLPLDHGFPARMVTPGLYGYTSATKWITEIELTTFDAYDAYWLQRGWAQVAPIKTMARIDTPKGLGRVSPGRVPIGGVAWAIHRGIDAVEVRIDGGPWQPARLGAVPNADTWRQWVFEWDATSGRHTIEARAVDGTGEVQTDRRAQPIPDGASGWHQVVVLVEG